MLHDFFNVEAITEWRTPFPNRIALNSFRDRECRNKVFRLSGVRCTLMMPYENPGVRLASATQD